MSLLKRIPPRVTYLIGILAGFGSIVGAFSPLWAVAGGILTLVVTTLQYKATGPTVLSFTEADWRAQEGEYRFYTGARHGKGRYPSVSVHAPRGAGGFAEVICDVHTLDSGEIVLGAGKPFIGQVRIV